jgi:hypothetical protein
LRYFAEKKVLNATYYEDFGVFKAAISARTTEAPTKNNAELDSLFTRRFQTFAKTQSLAA